MNEFFDTISLEAAISSFAAVASFLLPTLYYILPVFFGDALKHALTKIFEPPVRLLFYIGRFALWIVGAIIIACVVPIVEQMETLAQVCGSSLFAVRPAVCGDGLSFKDFVRNSHVHTLQMMIWLFCAWISWIFLVAKVRKVLHKTSPHRAEPENEWSVELLDDDGCKDTVMASYYFVGFVFVAGAFIQQFLERYLK